MKYLLIIGLLIGGYYLYMNNQQSEVQITTYQEVLDKAEGDQASQDEVKKGALLLATRFCNDSYFQETGGSSTSACLSKLESQTSRCNESVFIDAPDFFYGKESVGIISMKFAQCAGVI
ncbi:hypothetical protein SAMN03080615_03663 [Amphritea atlantica]|uniref:Uncharacterized protein n=1 Tax=Amphritea atlantica TaxID=355243 RepID=A0A1H9KU11_9GAMM|nr:hypothetical protein [Amphritea atlantica]SER02664.1 hypothetical protein SAMN03080615_03663 [Amphritea atlantica]